VVAGTPVYSFDSGLDVDQQFYGLSADLALDRWDMSAFFFEQTADSLLDRRAIGGEVRYFDPTKTLLGLIDYDIHYEHTNIAFLSGTWALGAKNSIYGSIDYRTSPLLTTSNALLGQTAVSLEELEELYTPSEIEAIAIDRTATTESLSLGATRQFTRTLQGTLDATFAELSDTEASAGVQATPGNRWNYYSVQMIKNDLALPRDVSILSLRYSDNDMADIYSLLASYRLPLNGWRINPQGRFDVRTNENDDRTRNELTIALRADYQVRRNVRLEMELGVGRADEQFEDVDQESSRYYARAGYYWDF